MYLDAILDLHRDQEVFVQMKSGNSFRGTVEQVNKRDYTACINLESDPKQVIFLDTRSIESFQVLDTNCQINQI